MPMTDVEHASAMALNAAGNARGLGDYIDNHLVPTLREGRFADLHTQDQWRCANLRAGSDSRPRDAIEHDAYETERYLQWSREWTQRMTGR